RWPWQAPFGKRGLDPAPLFCVLARSISRDCVERREFMAATSYSRLAAVIFSLVALLQLVRALAGWPITIADTTIPLWPSWVAFVVAAGLAWLGFTASRA